MTYTEAAKGRKRKHRWDSAEGKVIAIRLPVTVYGRLKLLSDKQGLTVSEWCRVSLTRAAGLLPDGEVRSHHKRATTNT